MVLTASRVSTDKLRLWLNANPMFTGGSDDEAVCIAPGRLVQARARFLKGKRTLRAQTVMSDLRPYQAHQKNLSTAAIPVYAGCSAISIQDYSRINNERSEFLNFLLAPNPAGIPVTEQALLTAA